MPISPQSATDCTNWSGRLPQVKMESDMRRQSDEETAWMWVLRKPSSFSLEPAYRAAVKTSRGKPQPNSDYNTQNISFNSFGPNWTVKTVHKKTVLTASSFVVLWPRARSRNTTLKYQNNELIISRPPDVHVTRWQVRWILLFKTGVSRILTMLKSAQMGSFLLPAGPSKNWENIDCSKCSPAAGPDKKANGYF